jgi:hypothetical protein
MVNNHLSRVACAGDHDFIDDIDILMQGSAFGELLRLPR